jgi:hypothetical protein
MGRLKTLSEFINHARRVHNDLYDYSKTEYVKSDIKVVIICKFHGEFTQLPKSHLYGKGCAKCGGSLNKTTEQFINESILLHDDCYDYSKTILYISPSKSYYNL